MSGWTLQEQATSEEDRMIETLFGHLSTPRAVKKLQTLSALLVFLRIDFNYSELRVADIDGSNVRCSSGELGFPTKDREL